MTLEVIVNGQRYGGWLTASVTRAVEQAASTFSVELTERWNGQAEAWGIPPGSECQVKLNGDLVMTGHTDGLEKDLDKGTRRIAVEGISKTGDLVECSAEVKGGQFNGYTPEEIARALAAPFGVNVVSEIDPIPVPEVQVQQGETPFEILERLCRLQGFLVSDTPAGDLRLFRVGEDRAESALRQGENIIRCALSIDRSNVYSEYKVKGQQAWTPGLTADVIAAPVARIVCERPARHRPLTLIAEGNASDEFCRKRAHWEAQRRAGRSVSVLVKVQGWHQSDGGPLWRENQLVSIETEDLDGELLIAECSYELSNRGRLTTLRLTYPEAYAPEPVARKGRKRKAAIKGKSAEIDWTKYRDAPA